MSELRDFEQTLRDDLATSAARIRPRPGAAEQAIAHAIGVRHKPVQRRRLSPWLLPMVAAAVALIVLSATVLGIGAGKGSNPQGPLASVQASATSRAPTPSIRSSQVVDGVHPVTCRVSEPTALATAFRPVYAPLGPGTAASTGLPILSVTPDGDVLAGPMTVPAQLDLITPDAVIKTLYTTADIPLTQYEFDGVDSAQADTRWIVFSVSTGASERAIDHLGVINRATGAVVMFREQAVTKPTTVWPPVLFDGFVYWAEVDSAATGSIFRYDPVAQKTTIVETGTQLSNPTPVGGGLYWMANGHLVTYRGGRLPAGFEFDASKLTAPITDGTTSVWVTTLGETTDSQLELRLSRPGMAAPVVLDKVAHYGFLKPLAVAGPFVIWYDPKALLILDTRTGAATTLAQGSSPDYASGSGGPVLAINSSGAKGGPQLSIAQIAALPELQC